MFSGNPLQGLFGNLQQGLSPFAQQAAQNLPAAAQQLPSYLNPQQNFWDGNNFVIPWQQQQNQPVPMPGANPAPQPSPGVPRPGMPYNPNPGSGGIPNPQTPPMQPQPMPQQENPYEGLFGRFQDMMDRMPQRQPQGVPGPAPTLSGGEQMQSYKHVSPNRMPTPQTYAKPPSGMPRLSGAGQLSDRERRFLESRLPDNLGGLY